MNKTIALLPLLAAPLLAQPTQVINPVGALTVPQGNAAYPIYSFNNATGVNQNLSTAGWAVHGYLRTNPFFNSNTTSASSFNVGPVPTSVLGHIAAWSQDAPSSLGAFNTRGAYLGNVTNPDFNPAEPSANVGTGVATTYRLPANFDTGGVPVQNNPSERQSASVSPNTGSGGGTGYLAAFGRSLGATGDLDNNGSIDNFQGRDVNRTLFWTETTNTGPYMWGVRFDVANQNNNAAAPDRATLAIRVDGKWYIAAQYDGTVYTDAVLPTGPALANGPDGVPNNFGASTGVYTLTYDFTLGKTEGIDDRYVWYELTFDPASLTGDAVTYSSTDLNKYSLSIDGVNAISGIDVFGTEGPNTVNPVYTQFPGWNITAWGVFMRYASGNRRIDNFGFYGAPGGGSHGQNADHGRNQRINRAQQVWAQHVRTQQQRAAQRHRLNQQN